MYNLIVSAKEDTWNGDPFQIEVSRAVSEYTDDDISEKFGSLDSEACVALQALPTLFAEETSNKKDARLGILTRIRNRRDEVRIEYEIIDRLPPISPDTILRLQWELDLGKLEMNRTHWAVKDVDLLEELVNAKILTRDQAAFYQQLLGKIGDAVPPIPTPAGQSPTRESVFISYAHKDKKFLDELLTHLRPLQQGGRVSVWSDRQIKPGSEWQAQIDAAVSSAKVALLLVTKDFLASDFIHDRELGPLLKRVQEEGIVLLWVLEVLPVLRTTVDLI